MKKLFPRLTKISFIAFAVSALVILSETGCGPKPACGNKRDHMKRKRATHRMAPGMG